MCYLQVYNTRLKSWEKYQGNILKVGVPMIRVVCTNSQNSDIPHLDTFSQKSENHTLYDTPDIWGYPLCKDCARIRQSIRHSERYSRVLKHISTQVYFGLLHNIELVSQTIFFLPISLKYYTSKTLNKINHILNSPNTIS